MHFETWAAEAVGAAAGVTAPLPMGPFPERALRPLLADAAGLDRLEAARAEVAAAAGPDVAAALDRLDRVFEEVTGRPAARGEGDSGGGRTVAYLDSHARPRRDARAAGARRAARLAPGGAGRVALVVREGLRPRGRAAGRDGAPGPLAPQLGPLMGAGFGLWNQLGDEQAELRRRWAAGDAFADWTPAWHGSNHHSADLQIAARSVEAIDAGDFLVVLGDFHGGDNPLLQGLFGLRHADPAALLRRYSRAAGPGRPPLAAAPRAGRHDRAQLADVPGGRRRRGRGRRARARRDPSAPT